MKYMMDTDDLANELKQFTLVAVVVKVGIFVLCVSSLLLLVVLLLLLGNIVALLGT